MSLYEPDLRPSGPPPPRTRGAGGEGPIVAVVATLLRLKPGEWHTWHNATHSSAGATALGKLGCEVAVRGGVVYVRWPK